MFFNLFRKCLHNSCEQVSASLIFQPLHQQLLYSNRTSFEMTRKMNFECHVVLLGRCSLISGDYSRAYIHATTGELTTAAEPCARESSVSERPGGSSNFNSSLQISRAASQNETSRNPMVITSTPTTALPEGDWKYLLATQNVFKWGFTLNALQCQCSLWFVCKIYLKRIITMLTSAKQ